jgi:demethylmenaquinone methyltransferase/2-methoxy-6-polyprenyl-1,4-benzoquinol methylase
VDEAFGRARFVRALFDSIAVRYDLTNRIISLGQIQGWRDRVAREARQHDPRLILDVGTGTADLALAVARRAPSETRILGVDLSPEMLRRARTKARRRGLDGHVSFVLADATALPLKDNTVDCLVNAFFLRHLPDLPAAFTESRRVLRLGGRIISLELTQPTLPIFRRLFHFFFRRLVPILGGWLSGNRQAYQYLPDSLESFPGASELGQLLRQADYESVQWRLLWLGTVAIHAGVKTTGLKGDDLDEQTR